MRSGRASLALGALAGAALAASALAHPPAPNALTQPVKDGCQRSPFALIPGTTPEWVYVYNTPASKPLPRPRWVSGVVSAYNPAYAAASPAGGDLPSGHTAYDFNVNIRPDPHYRYLLAGPAAIKVGNYADDSEETQRLHTEWEDLTLPRFAWAQAGDRVTELGSWVWDCGHWGTKVSVFDPTYAAKCGGGRLGSSTCPFTGEETEFHPYRVLWDQRATSPNSPYGEQQADLFISTDQTPAGTIADCAHKNPPPPGSTQTYGPDYQACVQTAPNWQDVTGHYSFFIPAPPRPSAHAQLRIRSVNHGSVRAPKPTLIPKANGVQVQFNLHSRPGQRVVLAYTFYVGWTDVPARELPVHLRVRLDKLTVHRAMDPGCTLTFPVPGCASESTNPDQLSTPPGEWNLYIDVNGIWRSWAPSPGEFDPVDGQVFPGHQTIDLYVAPGHGWTLYSAGRECDLGLLKPGQHMADCRDDTHEIATNNDVPGQIVDTYRSISASLGTHTSDGQTQAKDPTSTCPKVNPHGCYSLTYTVSLVNDASARARSLATTTRRGRHGGHHRSRRHRRAHHRHRARPHRARTRRGFTG